jgi:hypothetical protein
MSDKVKNVVDLVNELVANNDLDAGCELAKNPEGFGCSIVLGAQKGQIYAFFYKTSNTSWVQTLLQNAYYLITEMRRKGGDVVAASQLDRIENELFNGDIHDFYLIEIGACKFFAEHSDLPMFYSI